MTSDATSLIGTIFGVGVALVGAKMVLDTVDNMSKPRRKRKSKKNDIWNFDIGF